MRQNKSVNAKWLFLALPLVMLKLGSLGWITATTGASNIMAPTQAYAQTKPVPSTSPDELVRADAKSRSKEGETDQERRLKPGGLDLEILKDVERRSRQLDKREADIAKKEEQINALKADIDKQLAELKALQSKIEESIVLRNDLEKTAITKLAKTYASMPPEAAGALIQKLDKSIAIRILNVMRDRAAGKILAAVPPELATELSEGLVRKR